MKLGAVLWVVVAMGCSKADSGTGSGPPRAANGKERGDCIKQAPAAEADDPVVGTCDPGLLCLSNLCVRPPPADCQAIADQLTSFELGNYAELEEREPVVLKYKRACTKAMVSKEQGECAAKATDKAGVFGCAPLMFPELGAAVGSGTGSNAECDKVVGILRSYMSRSVGGTQDPQMQKMLDTALGAMTASCAEDNWPDAFKQCILLAGDNTDAMNKCNAQMPPDIQQKLTDRMMKSMQPQMPSP